MRRDPVNAPSRPAGRPHPKRVAREQRLARQRRVALMRLAGGVLAIALLVGGGASVYRSDVLSVEQIDVQGATQISVDEALALAAVPDDTTLLRFPAAAVEQRLQDHPWIAAAEVVRRFPDGMVITVIEREAVAFVDLGEATLWLIDEDGHFLEARAPTPDERLIVIRDVPDITPVAGETIDSPVLANARAVLAGISSELRVSVRALSAPSIERTALVTYEDVEVVIGAADQLEQKDMVARRILEEQEGRAVYINVRTPDRPTWRGVEGLP